MLEDTELMQLSRDFYLHEFLVSETAARNDIIMAPSDNEIDNLRRLCRWVLQPLRNDLKAPVIVTSGYRPPELNKLIGGSTNSQHMRGEAADIRAIGFTPIQIAEAIIRLNLPFHQLIYEFGSWVHVSVHPNGDSTKYQVITASRHEGKTVYEPGLPA